jgi:ribonuclease-3
VGAIYLDQGYDAVMRFMNKRILAQMVNLDKVAYKEVNFKSKLLEWTQKNRVRMEFKMLRQTKDDKGSPVFGFQVVIEGVDGGKGQGFSKKEAQQLASKETLLRLRREPQFIDAIFQAKSERTKMEEEPTAVAPDLNADKNFIIKQENDAVSDDAAVEVFNDTEPAQAPDEQNTDEFLAKRSDLVDYDLSDITHNPVEASREDIIAAAEEAAFRENHLDD